MKFKSTFLSGSILFLALSLNAQTIVSTTAQNKKFLIEKGTGQVCSSCPALGDTCVQVANSHPGKGIVIEYHVGPDARPQIGLADYTTPYGDSLYNSLPFTYNMMVNRNDQGLPYGYTYVYNQVRAGAEDILTQASPLNLAVAPSYDKATRKLIVKVEGYYTANASTSTNLLNVAITEDSLISKQTDARVSGLWVNNYAHMHVFRTFLTGYWGDSISTTTMGTLVSKTYSYTVPAKYNSKNCHIIVFMTEQKSSSGKQNKAGNVITAEQAPMEGGTSGIESHEKQENISLYPNPSTGIFSIERQETGYFSVSITDLAGRTVYSADRLNRNKADINLSACQKGIYFVRTLSDKGFSMHKILITE